jgi:sterol desaturase/sphingolipid hydroxylase (fatty acid hydroxylase superfamily)
MFLVFSGVAFTVAERLWPRAAQRWARRGLALDIALVLLNVEVVGALVAIWLASWMPTAWVAGWRQQEVWRWLTAWPAGAQGLLLFTVKDFLQYGVHNVLHRVPVLWRFHRLHHSTQEMDWLSNWRFHSLEIVFYQVVLYLPSALLGFAPEVMFACAVASTTLGHFAHANVRWQVGWLRYVINCPEMHRWHHVHPECGPRICNLGVALTLWDWLFGTAHAPGEDPAKLGLEANDSVVF